MGPFGVWKFVSQPCCICLPTCKGQEAVRAPGLCVGCGPSPLSPLAGTPWVAGCLQEGQEYQSSVSFLPQDRLSSLSSSSPPPSSQNPLLLSTKLLLQPGNTRSPFPASVPGWGSSFPPKASWARQDPEPCSSAWGVRAAPRPQPRHGLSVSMREERLLNLCLCTERETKAGREGGRQTRLHLGDVMVGFPAPNGQ